MMFENIVTASIKLAQKYIKRQIQLGENRNTMMFGNTGKGINGGERGRGQSSL